MLVLAHRGYHLRSPENTVDAFAAAVALGVDGIETDIRLSRDGIPILIHDRVIAGNQPVASLTVTALSHLVGYAVPTLDSALAQFTDILWNLEIKTLDAADATVEVLKRFLPARKILISSFWHPVVEQVAWELDVEGGVLVSHCPRDGVDVCAWLPTHPRIRTIVWHYETCSPLVIEQARSKGIRHFVYGAETAEEMTALRAMGVDGVITDHPDRALR